MVNLTIDNKAISVPAGTTIMEAAEDWRLPCLRCRNGGKRETDHIL